MQRVAILGCGGAGKSELARSLAARTGLRLVHLDPIFWRPGWTPAPGEAARRALDEAAAGERWILDGNFLQHGPDERLRRADTVVFLDLPRSTCLRRVLLRVARDRRRHRTDLPDGCCESLDVGFLREVWRYPSDERPHVLALLDGLADGVAVHHLRTPGEVRRFLAAANP